MICFTKLLCWLHLTRTTTMAVTMMVSWSDFRHRNQNVGINRLKNEHINKIAIKITIVWLFLLWSIPFRAIWMQWMNAVYGQNLIPLLKCERACVCVCMWHFAIQGIYNCMHFVQLMQMNLNRFFTTIANSKVEWCFHQRMCICAPNQSIFVIDLIHYVLIKNAFWIWFFVIVK